MGREGRSHVIFGMPEPKEVIILYINLVLILLLFIIAILLSFYYIQLNV